MSFKVAVVQDSPVLFNLHSTLEKVELLTKKAVHEGLTNGLNEQLELEEKYQTLAGKSKDFEEGVNAFLEKRKAVFKGE